MVGFVIGFYLWKCCFFGWYFGVVVLLLVCGDEVCLGVLLCQWNYVDFYVVVFCVVGIGVVVGDGIGFICIQCFYVYVLYVLCGQIGGD